jgi:uncharacterized protein YndB with AHSA1/START domain
MTGRSVTHATFSVERIYDASPADVFAAFSDKASKRRWFVEGEGFEIGGFDMDFRPGGIESSTFRFGDGPWVRSDMIYHDIVENERIIFSYSMSIGSSPFSVSLGTMQLVPEGGGTRLVYTEQGAYLDGHDDVAGREVGSRGLLEALARELERGKAA